MAELYLFNTTANASPNNDAPPDGWPENTMDYSDVNDAARELYAAIARHVQDANGSLNSGGVAPDYTLTLNRTSITSLGAAEDGIVVGFQCHADNSGAVSTLNVNATGAIALELPDGSAPTLFLNGIYLCVYDNTNTRWQVLTTTVPQNQLFPFDTLLGNKTLSSADQNRYQLINANGVDVEVPAAGIGGAGAIVGIVSTSGNTFNLVNSTGGTIYFSFSATSLPNGNTESGLAGTYYTLRQLTGSDYLLSDW